MKWIIPAFSSPCMLPLSPCPFLRSAPAILQLRIQHFTRSTVKPSQSMAGSFQTNQATGTLGHDQQTALKSKNPPSKEVDTPSLSTTAQNRYPWHCSPPVNKDTCHLGLRWAAPLSATKKSLFPEPIQRTCLWLKLSLLQYERQHQECHLGCSSPTPSTLPPSGHICMWVQLPTTQQQHSSKRGYSNDLFFLIIVCWAGTLGKQHYCFPTIMVPLVKKQSKTTGRSFLLQVLSNQKEKGWEFRATFLLWAASLLWRGAPLQVSHSTAVLQPVTHTIVPKSWDFKSTLALNGVGGRLILPSSRRMVGGNFSHPEIGGSSTE